MSRTDLKTQHCSSVSLAWEAWIIRLILDISLIPMASLLKNFEMLWEDGALTFQILKLMGLVMLLLTWIVTASVSIPELSANPGVSIRVTE